MDTIEPDENPSLIRLFESAELAVFLRGTSRYFLETLPEIGRTDADVQEMGDIRASKNVSSVADNGAGDYTVNFMTPMPDVNFVMLGAGSGESEGPGGGVPRQGPTFSTSSNTTTSCRVRTGYDNGALYDWPTIGLAFIR